VSDSRPKRVLLIVSGGIAAYKTPDLVRKLRAEQLAVQVVATDAALAFVSELALATVSGRAVRRSLLDPAEEGRVGHIELADWADLVLVAPATADLIARAAAGLANDLATTVLLATRAPVLWAPAMNSNMWAHPATQANLAVLRDRGARFVGPDRGELACGWIGEGRMMDPPIIVEAAKALLDEPLEGSRWSGRRVLITAGPTRAYLDPVRFVSNASTGIMGFSIAKAAVERGAEVVLITGPVALSTPFGVRRIDVETGAQMLAACEAEFARGPLDVLAMVAAVADLIPAQPAADKLAKEQVVARMATMAWTSEVDILATLAARHRDRTRMLGFGAQTVSPTADAKAIEATLVREGTQKLARKGCHALFVNRVGIPDSGFASPTNAGHLLFAKNGTEGLTIRSSGAPRPKAELAGWLIDELGRTWFGD
jgi:phosphopantothenoylcysteine decarboxylase/phosphopantothenate--cysteine ligase